jgi:hypothetical protein
MTKGIDVKNIAANIKMIINGGERMICNMHEMIIGGYDLM